MDLNELFEAISALDNGENNNEVDEVDEVEDSMEGGGKRRRVGETTVGPKHATMELDWQHASEIDACFQAGDNPEGLLSLLSKMGESHQTEGTILERCFLDKQRSVLMCAAAWGRTAWYVCI